MAYATFRIPNTIIHGDDALTHLSKLEGKRASIVTGGQLNAQIRLPRRNESPT